MYKNLEILTPQTHKKLCFTKINTFEFAKEQMLIPLTMKEMIIAEKFYPIVFKKEEVIPYALLGIPQRKNFYLLPDGRWKVPYVPNYIRQYPFAWLKTRQEYKIGADLSAPHFSHLDGSPLFPDFDS
jgi:hypothetical protein